MRLTELFDLVERERGSDHIKKWITDCLGSAASDLKNPIKIGDFTGDIETRILCLNFLKEIKINMPGTGVYRKIILLLEDYLKDRAAKHPAFRIDGFSRFLSEQGDDFLCAGAEIKDKPAGFSNITALQDIILYNIPGGSAVTIEDINDLNVEEKIESIKLREAQGLPMNPLRTELPLFWCTRSDDITGICRGRANKADAVRDELGLSSRTSGYLVEFRLSNDYVDEPHKPIFFDSGPNSYFYVAGTESEYGNTRRLSDLCLTKWTEAVHKEKEWPSDDMHDIIPLGNLGTLPTCSKAAKEKALQKMWEDLTGRFPEIVEEIRDLYYNR